MNDTEAKKALQYRPLIFHHHRQLVLLATTRNQTAVQSPKLKKVLNDTIYQELSWAAKLLLLKDVMDTDGTPFESVTSPMPLPYEPDLGFVPEPVPARRIPPIEALVVERRQEEDPPVTKGMNDDDNSMRLKLFRLMYETIKDSDVKCKRAELIRSHYENSSSFEIGYLMGDVMDKYNIMSDISMTLNRLFHEWKPIEHINAYEQISNQAIEINHLIDMMKGITKKTKKEDKSADKGNKRSQEPFDIFGGLSISKN